MIDMHARVCELDAERHRLQQKLYAALALIDGFTQRYLDRWVDEPDDTLHIVIHDRAYYENDFLPDLITILESAK